MTARLGRALGFSQSSAKPEERLGLAYDDVLIVPPRSGVAGLEAELVFATAEHAPLGLFGPRASEAVARILEQRGILLRMATVQKRIASSRLLRKSMSAIGIFQPRSSRG